MGDCHWGWLRYGLCHYTFKFTGTQFSIYSDEGDYFGISEVQIDGKVVGTIDQFSPAYVAQTCIFTSNVLTNGAHTVLVTNKGNDPNQASDENCYDVDYIAYK